MKKLLTVLSSLAILSPAVSSVVSCGGIPTDTIKIGVTDGTTSLDAKKYQGNNNLLQKLGLQIYEVLTFDPIKFNDTEKLEKNREAIGQAEQYSLTSLSKQKTNKAEDKGLSVGGDAKDEFFREYNAPKNTNFTELDFHVAKDAQSFELTSGDKKEVTTKESSNGLFVFKTTGTDKDSTIEPAKDGETSIPNPLDLASAKKLLDGDSKLTYEDKKLSDQLVSELNKSTKNLNTIVGTGITTANFSNSIDEPKTQAAFDARKGKFVDSEIKELKNATKSSEEGFKGNSPFYYGVKEKTKEDKEETKEETKEYVPDKSVFGFNNIVSDPKPVDFTLKFQSGDKTFDLKGTVDGVSMVYSIGYKQIDLPKTKADDNTKESLIFSWLVPTSYQFIQDRFVPLQTESGDSVDKYHNFKLSSLDITKETKNN